MCNFPSLKIDFLKIEKINKKNLKKNDFFVIFHHIWHQTGNWALKKWHPFEFFVNTLLESKIRKHLLFVDDEILFRNDKGDIDHNDEKDEQQHDSYDNFKLNIELSNSKLKRTVHLSNMT